MTEQNELRTIALRLYDLGFHVVPVDKNKRPLVPSWVSTERIDRKTLENALKNATGIAIVAGPENPFKRIGYKILLVDVDDPNILEKTPYLKELIEKTAHWKTGPRCPKCGGKDIEVIEPGRKFRCKSCKTEFTIENAKRGLGALFKLTPDAQEYFKSTIRKKAIEFLVNNYQLIPPSLHPSGVRYEWVNPINLKESDLGIYTLAGAEAEAILKEVKEALGEDDEEEKGEGKGKAQEGALRELTDEQIEKLFNLLKDAYSPGQRQNLVLYLAGWFAKDYRIHPLSVVKLVKKLYDASGDEDSLKMRLGAMVYSYKKAGIDVDPFAQDIEQLTGVKAYGLERSIKEAEVKGKSGVYEILEETFGEKKAVEIIKEIEKILGPVKPAKAHTQTTDSLDPNPNVAMPEYCIEYNHIYDFCEESLLITNVGIRLLIYGMRTNENGVKEVTVAKSKEVLRGSIQRIVNMKLKGVTMEEQFIKLVINGKELIGTPSEVVDNLKDDGVEQRLKPSIVRLLLANAVDVEERFYSPGPWIVDNHIEIAEAPGYLPKWKSNVKYKLLQDGDPGRGIKLLADIMNAYGNPAKAMTVLSYGVIAWAKYFFVETFGYFPHLIINGPAEVGKTLLIEVLRILYNFSKDEEDENPKTDFQLRKVLAKSTVPAMLTEGNFLMSFLQANNNLLSTLVLSATSNRVHTSGSSATGSSEYAGLFLAVRSLIIPTNMDVTTFAKDVRDKTIVVYISKNEGFTNDPSVKTPRKMDDRDKADINAVLREALKIFERRLGEIKKELKDANREKANEYYIKLGYSILKEIADRAGVSLPEPYIPSIIETEEDFNEIVRGGFLQFVEEKRQMLAKNGVSDFIDPIDPRGALDRYGFFIDTERGLLVFGVPLLTEYSVELAKKYGLQKLSWKSISEILGVKRTRITRYGVTLNNVFEYDIEATLRELCKGLDGKAIEPDAKELQLCSKFGFYDNENGVFRLYPDDQQEIK